MAQVETVQVVRPVKVLAFVCGLIAVILLIVAIATNSWVEADDPHSYNEGLWQICGTNVAENVEECKGSEIWALICGILCIVSLLAAVIVVIITAVALWNIKDYAKKFELYRAACYLMFAAFVVVLVGLIVFPVMFMQVLDDKYAIYLINDWYFAYSYGICWGAAIFEVGCAILLLIDKENDEIYYKEKTTY